MIYIKLDPFTVILTSKLVVVSRQLNNMYVYALLYLISAQQNKLILINSFIFYTVL